MDLEHKITLSSKIIGFKIKYVPLLTCKVTFLSLRDCRIRLILYKAVSNVRKGPKRLRSASGEKPNQSSLPCTASK